MGCDECSEVACLCAGYELTGLTAPMPDRTTLGGIPQVGGHAQSLRTARRLSAPIYGVATLYMADQEPMLSFNCHFEAWYRQLQVSLRDIGFPIPATDSRWPSRVLKAGRIFVTPVIRHEGSRRAYNLAGNGG
jgi:hypothetical protein